MIGKHQRGKTIQRQILNGYFLLTGMIALLVAVSIFCLYEIQRENRRATEYQQQQYTAQQVITAHYKWLEELSAAITIGGGFQGSLDPDTCALGKWINLEDENLNKDAQMKAALSNIITPHREIHLEAGQLIERSKSDQAGAYESYNSDFKPKVEAIGQGLGIISERFQAQAQATVTGTERTGLICNICLVLLGVFAVITSLIIGRRLSRRIATPILSVARWSEEFATGIDNLNLDQDEAAQHHAVEINRMIESFRIMAQTIRGNVRIIKRVAQGDLTAYVEIRSDGDSLGRNLYHLVQNNDFMFSNLLRVADSVATNAGHIASASQSLAESSTTQAGAVEVLSVTVGKADALALENVDRSAHAMESINETMRAVEDGQGRMDVLVAAVNEINAASEKIAQVMKSINDIAFATNLLALNAAVEAARAGAAGKGFAVVADEVRNLAAKSAEAADQSRLLIEDTIFKATEGRRIAGETSATFREIVVRTNELTGKMEEISAASHDQQLCMDEVQKEIMRISSVVTENAATSEETAAATQQMNANAELIRSEMQRFNLRKREPGKPYIPPEKADDPDFVRIAHENYQKAKERKNDYQG